MLERDGYALVPRLIEPDEAAFWRDRFAEPVRAGRGILSGADTRIAFPSPEGEGREGVPEA